MHIAVVANDFPLGKPGGGIFIARRMIELAKTDDVFGIHILDRDLADWKYRKAAVAVLGTAIGSRVAAFLFRLSRGGNPKARALVVDGRARGIVVYSFRLITDSNVPAIAEGSRRRIIGFIRARGCDVVHSHFLWYADTGAWIASELKVPHVISAHGSDVNRTMREDAEKRTLFLGFLERADAVFFVSRVLLEQAKSIGFSGRAALVVHNGYDPGVFHPPEGGAGRSGANRILFVGNLLAVKGVDRLVRIFALVRQGLPNATLDIVGSDAEEGWGERLREESFRSGLGHAVSLRGALDQRDVAELMRKADILIVPSRSEGFGCVAIEAQACGTPVLGAAVGGLPEAIGIPEMTVPQEGDFEAAFAERIVEVLRSGVRPIRSDIASLTWSETVQRERRVYARLKEKGRGD